MTNSLFSFYSLLFVLKRMRTKMLRLCFAFLLCWINVHCFDITKYDDMLRHIMEEDDEERMKRSLEVENYGSGEPNNPGGDLTPETLSLVIIMAIVVTSFIALGTFFFLASCAWYKYKARYSTQPFTRLTLDDGDESGLNMVDYDELNIQHSQLTIDETRQETTSSNFNKT